MKRNSVTVAIALIFLAACGGGDGGSSNTELPCQSITGGGSQVTSNCSGCSISNERAAADGNVSTLAKATVGTPGTAGTAAIRSTAQPGIVYPAGSNAGVYYRPGGSLGCNNCGITVTTYLDGSAQESQSGTNNSIFDGIYFTGINTLLPFDAVEIVDSADTSPTGDGTLLDVFEICSDR